jgi:hypothetical protein
VNYLPWVETGGEDFNRDLLKPLPAETPIQLLDAKLAGDAESAGELVKEALVSRRLRCRLVRQALKDLGATTMFDNPAGEFLEVLGHSPLQLVRRFS